MASAGQISRADPGSKKKCDHKRVIQEIPLILASSRPARGRGRTVHAQSLWLIRRGVQAIDKLVLS
jgi:hypothetical protein